MLGRFLSILCFFIVLSWLFTRKQNLQVAQTPTTALFVNLNDTISAQSLTAILPVSISHLSALPDTLIPFLSPSKLHEVVILTPESKMAATRAIIRDFVSLLEDFPHPDFSIRAWPSHLTQPVATLRVSSQIVSDWILILDDSGLTNIAEDTRRMLLNPPPVDYPLGPRGMQRSACLTQTAFPQPATYLVPPFVLPRILAYPPSADLDSEYWLNLGVHVSTTKESNYGGIALSLDKDEDSIWCSQVCHHDSAQQTASAGNVTDSFDLYPEYSSFSIKDQPILVLLLPFLSDLEAFISVPCKLQENGFLVFVALYAPSLTNQDHHASFGTCVLQYVVLSDPLSYLAYLRHTLMRAADVILSLDELEPDQTNIPWIGIPRDDLAYSTWMGSLSLIEWQNWHRPRVDISIITKDRPQSLQRLLRSLSNARFYGDTLHLRINMEQSADEETMRIAQEYEWTHGNVFLHHRVVHGGLLPAVVESWYPASDHSYGVLLEDDVELSPLFYAWVKMTILRYRYGADRQDTAQLFGISLYQQKHIELHPTGRSPFSARELFASSTIHPSSPYLSQIPCSWGAVYFPEHWRLFHTYLTLRFSQISMSIGTPIVPDVRSNRWTKSWKRYFIEMVYLRGYVMLYPNYEDFVSLSTNHLEVGAHVKSYDEEKQRLFMLPLMKDEEHSTLLSLPGETLPEWRLLPVLNLTGAILSLEEVQRIGWTRSAQLSNCAAGEELELEQYGSQQLLHVCSV